METSDHDYLHHILEREEYVMETLRLMNEEFDRNFLGVINEEARHLSTSAEEETDGLY